MVGVKDFSKGFYVEFIRVWKIINKENKLLSMSEIKGLFEKELKKKLFQSLLYKTLISFNEFKLSNYNNLKWNLNFEKIEEYFKLKKTNFELQKRKSLKEFDEEIKLYKDLIKLVKE